MPPDLAAQSVVVYARSYNTAAIGIIRRISAASLMWRYGAQSLLHAANLLYPRAALTTGSDPICLDAACNVALPRVGGGVHTSEHFMQESFNAASYTA